MALSKLRIGLSFDMPRLGWRSEEVTKPSGAKVTQ